MQDRISEKHAVQIKMNVLLRDFLSFDALPSPKRLNSSVCLSWYIYGTLP